MFSRYISIGSDSIFSAVTLKSVLCVLSDSNTCFPHLFPRFRGTFPRFVSPRDANCWPDGRTSEHFLSSTPRLSNIITFRAGQFLPFLAARWMALKPSSVLSCIRAFVLFLLADEDTKSGAEMIAATQEESRDAEMKAPRAI